MVQGNDTGNSFRLYSIMLFGCASSICLKKKLTIASENPFKYINSRTDCHTTEDLKFGTYFVWAWA